MRRRCSRCARPGLLEVRLTSVSPDLAGREGRCDAARMAVATAPLRRKTERRAVHRGGDRVDDDADRSLGVSAPVPVPQQPSTPTWAWNWRATLDRSAVASSTDRRSSRSSSAPGRRRSCRPRSSGSHPRSGGRRSSGHWRSGSTARAAAERCADGGSIVAVSSCPPPSTRPVTVPSSWWPKACSRSCGRWRHARRTGGAGQRGDHRAVHRAGRAHRIAAAAGLVPRAHRCRGGRGVQMLGSSDALGLTGEVLRATGGRA